MAQFDDEKQKKDLEELYKKEEEELVRTLAEEKYKLPYIDLYHEVVDNEALRAVSEEEARGANIAPFKLSGKKVFIAVRSPKPELLERLSEDMTRRNLSAVFYMASLASLEKVWDRYTELSMAESSRLGGLDISAETLRKIAADIHKMQDIENYVAEVLKSESIHKISRLLEVIFAGAIAIKASDIHIEPTEHEGRLRFRLDGILQDVGAFGLDVYRLINSRIKLLSGMKLTSKISQDGRFSIMEANEEISIRSSMIPGAYGESIVMRILDPKSIRVPFPELGIEPYLLKIMEGEIAKPNGLILVTGPTGSGKTTTLYAFLQKIYSPEINIITIEDPIEYHLKGITQTQVNVARGYTFPEGLKSALRQDPDVIMVGEIRDGDTAGIAVQSALTGHMVFSTLHTNNAAGVIPRLIDLGVNPKILVSALSISMAQRLVRRLCNDCKVERAATKEEGKLIGEIIKKLVADGKKLDDHKVVEGAYKLWDKTGCEKCNMTGFLGQIGVFEAIRTDENIERAIVENPSERKIKKIASTQGILSMREDGIAKVLRGVTSLEELSGVVDLGEE